MRVLLIEDEDHIREVAQVSLEAIAGWEVLGASSGTDGVRIAGQRHPDAILLDVMMPDMDGPSTLERLQAQESTADIPVVFLTAKTQSADVRHLTELGAAGVIAKPFDPMTLAHQLSDILAWPQ